MRSIGQAREWDPEVIDQAIPLLPESSRNGSEGTTSDDEPPVNLGEEALRVWRGERPKVKHAGEIDRSASLIKIGRVLFDAGATRTVIVPALAERDEALGWHKYTGRRDSEERYHEIVDELEANGRGPRLKGRPLKPSSDEGPNNNGYGTGEAFGHNLTDLGNSERFVAQHGEDVRYCYPWGKWLVWTGARWEQDSSGRVYRLAKETVRSIYREAAAAEDEGRRKALAQHATRSEAERRIGAMLELAKSEVPVSPGELDADPWLLNAPNGTADLRTGERRPHRREDLLTKMAGAEYDPDAAAPTWVAFLERVLPGEHLRGFVRRAAGYSATGDTSEQCMFINHGPGANGKSTAQEALAEALGDYAMRTPTEMLLTRRSGTIPNDVARLKGARFVAASETEEGRHLAESLVKDLTGQDTISARFMRAEWFDFKPSHKLWLSTNHKPEIRGTDNAIWRRIRLIPWSVVIPPAEQDRKLPGKLRDELPGILAWVVQGCLEWRRIGLQAPDEVRRATGEYRAEMDVLAGFIADCCERGEHESAYAGELWKAWQRWCEETGERPGTQKKFGGRLADRGFLNHRDSRTGRKKWFGVSLRDDWEVRAGISLNHPTTRFAGKTREAEPSEPKNDINASKNETREVMREQGSEGSEGSVEEPEEAPLSDDLEPGQSAMLSELKENRARKEAAPAPAVSGDDVLATLLDKPPDWLRTQLKRCREDERLIKPTCSTVAYEVFGTATRWEEVRPHVVRWLKGGGDA